MGFNFSKEETKRYSRNLMLPEVAEGGQERFRSGRIVVVGAGGIGSAALFYLAAAGVGHIGIADGDSVELSNLQRQILHRVKDLGRRKVDSARDSIMALNPHCRLTTYDLRLDPENVRKTLQGYDVVLDASDNFETRFLLADCCWLEKIPLVSAAAAGLSGLLLVVDPNKGSPCYRCLMPQPPPGSHQEGILGAVAGVMGCLQATEAMKLLLGRDSDLERQMLSYDGLKCRFRSITRTRKADCALCGDNPSVSTLVNFATPKRVSGFKAPRKNAVPDGEPNEE